MLRLYAAVMLDSGELGLKSGVLDNSRFDWCTSVGLATQL